VVGPDLALNPGLNKVGLVQWVHSLLGPHHVLRVGGEFVHEFGRPGKKGVKSLTLKELLPKYVLGKSNS